MFIRGSRWNKPAWRISLSCVVRSILRSNAVQRRLHGTGQMDKIHLALPGRDETIEQFKQFIRNLGQAGVYTTTFTWEPTGVWSSEPGESRGTGSPG